MSQQELLKCVVEALDDAGIEYMITGSTVSSLQGEPRATHDIDVIVAIDESDVGKIVKAFPPAQYYLDEVSIRRAISRKSMFNVIDSSEGTKVDFWILKDEPFDRSRFSRRCTERVFGLDVRISRPEDTILAKLRWAVESGGSEKQFTDALRVFEVQRGEMDLAYVESWTEELGIQDLWNRLQAEAEPGE